jgi:hypothetical protein
MEGNGERTAGAWDIHQSPAREQAPCHRQSLADLAGGAPIIWGAGGRVRGKLLTAPSPTAVRANQHQGS